MRKQRVDVRVEAELLEELQMIAEREGIRGRSAAIRESIANYVLDYKDGWNSTILKLSIPNRLAERVQGLVIMNDAKNAEDAVEKALEFWTADREGYYLKRRDRMESIVAEKVRHDTAIAELRKSGRSQVRR